ncbi:MAG: hypothetical protein AABX53_03140 [Nanoarchaeota archaeon]
MTAIVLIVAKEYSALFIGALVATIATLFFVAWSVDSALLFMAGVIPLGVYLAWLGRDELVLGRPWFMALMGVSVLAMVLSLVFEQEAIAQGSGAIFACSGIALFLSYRRRWTRVRGAWESKV